MTEDLRRLAQSEINLALFAYGNEPPVEPPLWPPRVEAAWRLAHGVLGLVEARERAREALDVSVIVFEEALRLMEAGRADAALFTLQEWTRAMEPQG